MKRIISIFITLFLCGNIANASPADSELFNAAKNGSIANIKNAIEKGANIINRDAQGDSAYEIAIANNQKKAAAFLKTLRRLKYSAGVYTGQMKNGAEDGWGVYHSFDKSMYSGSFKKGKASGIGIWRGIDGILYGGEFDEKGSHGKIMQLNDRELYGKDKYGEGVLCRAVKQGNILKIRLLLNRDTDVNEACIRGQSPLHFAAYEGNTTVMQYLINADAVIDAKDEDGMTPLHFAVWGGKKAAAELLLLKGASIHTRNNHGSTPLHLAAYQNNGAVIELLLKKGANINAKDNEGKTAYEHAVILNNENVIKLLKRLNASN